MANVNPEGFREECLKEPLHRVMGADQGPTLVERREPVYSAQALASRISGIAIVSVAILSSGEVCDAKVVRGISSAVDASILEAVVAWRFEPARLKGVPIAVVYSVAIEVDLRSTAAATS